MGYSEYLLTIRCVDAVGWKLHFVENMITFSVLYSASFERASPAERADKLLNSGGSVVT